MIPGLKRGKLPPSDPRRSLANCLCWFPWNLVQLIAFLFVCLVLIPLALLVRRVAGRSDIALWMAHKWWGPIVVSGGMARWSVQGLSHWKADRTYLVVANHQSYFDIPLLYATLPPPLHFLGADRLGKIPGIGHFGHAVGTIYLNRDSNIRAGKACLELIDYLRQGKTTVVFPEGTRSWDGQMRSFSPTLLTSAIHAGVDILPVAIVGTRSIMPRGGSFFFRPGRVEVRVGAPISTEGFSSKDRSALARVAWDAVDTLSMGQNISGSDAETHFQESRQPASQWQGA